MKAVTTKSISLVVLSFPLQETPEATTALVQIVFPCSYRIASCNNGCIYRMVGGNSYDRGSWELPPKIHHKEHCQHNHRHHFFNRQPGMLLYHLLCHLTSTFRTEKRYGRKGGKPFLQEENDHVDTLAWTRIVKKTCK